MKSDIGVFVLLTVLALGFALPAGTCLAATVEVVAPEELTVEIMSNLDDFSFRSEGGYDYVEAEGAALLPEGGIPALPRVPYHVAIPAGMRLDSIVATPGPGILLEGRFNIVPTQPPAILSGGAAAWTAGRPDIYMSDDAFPANVLGGVHEGFMGDTKILSFHVSPFSFNPASGSLRFFEIIDVRVVLAPASSARPFRRGGPRRERFVRMVEDMVANPEKVPEYSVTGGPCHLLGAGMLEEADFEYVVVTPDSLASTFQPLVDWKSQKGVTATCVTLEWILANYTGDNTQDIVRNFLKDAYQTWGTVWVLLGADTGILPSRQVFAMDAEMGANGNRIRSDLYFADLDGTWNDNGVSPYGEVDDNVDMYPELIVGRAPAQNIAEAVVFVDKVLTYEKNPPSAYPLKMLMPGEILWTDPLTDAGVGLDRIDEDLIPPRFDPITKLYETQGNETVESVLAAMSAGQNFVLHDGHCNETVMGAGDGYIYLTDADTLSNGSRTFILNSIGCWPAAIDRDCIAERFMNNPNGGCVAFIGNCRYGWGSPGNPGFGYSDVFQYEWARSVFAQNVLPLGQAHMESKAIFAGFAGEANVYRWNEFQLNLLGCPEMPVWTDDPEELSVTAPAEVMASGDLVRVVVEDAAGPVENALVCIMNGDDLYLRGRTDISGSISFSVSTGSPDSLSLTVTAGNHLPHESMIDVIAEGVLLEWTNLAVADAGDGMVNPGETVGLAISVENFGSDPDSGVWGHLSSTDGMCSMVESTVYYGALDPGLEVSGAGSFTAAFDASVRNGETVMLELTLSDSTSEEWTFRVPVVIAAPVLSVASCGVDDQAGGDADWVVEPDEEVLVTLEIVNDGLTYGDADVTVSTLDPHFSVVDSVISTGRIGASSAGFSLHKVTVAPGCPEPHVGMLEVTIDASDGQTFIDTVYFAVGDLAFADNCESGEGAWFYDGMWHLTTYRSHSDSTSWYFGDDMTHQYVRDADGRMRTPVFLAGEESRFSFWYWHDFPTYGVDGIYVIMIKNGVRDTLDFFGSGGALGDGGVLNIPADWTLWERMLPGVEPGDSVAMELGFTSDSDDNAEGIYIDDISFSCKAPVITSVGGPVEERPAIRFSAYPNPAYSCVTVAFAEARERVSLDIYSVDGRLVARLVKPAGARSVSWDLVDEGGRRVAPG
ncbi:MAG: C25 family cysteine peptidase, partial [bacterium]